MKYPSDDPRDALPGTIPLCSRSRMATTTRPGRRIGALLAGLPLAILAGCKEETSERYRVPKPPQQRLLGAILPHGDRTWFFKLLGPEDAVEKHAKEFKQFVHSVRFTDDKS